MTKNSFVTQTVMVFAITFSLFFQAEAAIIYVDTDAVGANNGANWTDAYTSLTDALSSALPGDEIWVSEGVYYPESVVDLNASGGIDAREAVFSVTDGIELYGGFSGLEVSLDERNWEVNLTILSGDIDENDLNPDADNIAESTADIVGNNSYHVIYTENVSAATRVDGFIITAGSADISSPVNVFDPNRDGGGWINILSSPTYASSPTVINSHFHGNYAMSEGGAFYSTSGPTGAEMSSLIRNCEFSGNKSDASGGAIYVGSFDAGNYSPFIIQCSFNNNEAYRRGGALYLLGDHAQIDSSTFENNEVTAISEDMTTLPGSGGAVSLVASNAEFSNCYFISNSATGNPTGAFEGGGGGAIYASTNEPQTDELGNSEPKFISCGFYSNSVGGNGAAWGGAATHLNDGGVLRPFYINCIFADNQAQNHGGAIANFTRVLGFPEGFSPALEPQITNSTFTQNHAGDRGGALYNSGYIHDGSQVLQARLENSVLWNNSAVTEAPEIYNMADHFITYSLIQGSGGSGGGWDTDLGTDGGNNIASNPQFINIADPLGGDNIPATNDDGLRLSTTSPAVDVGNNFAPDLAGISFDYLGSSRILGGDVDMGAYERAGIIPPGLDIYWLEPWPGVHPPCLTCPFWSFLMFDRIFRGESFVWNGPAQLIKYSDYAIIKGEIISKSSRNTGFKVHIKLKNPNSWEKWNRKGGSYFAFTPEAQKIAAEEHKEWLFWELAAGESYFKGFGDIKGKLRLYHWPRSRKFGFQFGQGANAWDGDTGLAGYFYYKGRIYYRGNKEKLRGIASMNTDAIPCEQDCVPLVKEAIPEITEQIKNSSEISVHDENLSLQVYPNPATNKIIVQTDNSVTESIITLYSISGQLVKELQHDSYTEIPAGDLSRGMYLLEIKSNNSKQIQKIILE